MEVWKHNQVEVVPTPNYEYKFVTTSHLRSSDLSLTRLDASSQEWCGASFKQYTRRPGGTPAWDVFQVSYMPEAGRRTAVVRQGDLQVVPLNALSLRLRGYDFAGRRPLGLLPDQKDNRLSDPEPFPAAVMFAGETVDGYLLDVVRDPREAEGTDIPERIGRFEFAKDRNHVMLAYEGADGQRYRLKSLERVDYWTRSE